MKVSELIEILKTAKPDAEISVSPGDPYGSSLDVTVNAIGNVDFDCHGLTYVEMD